MEFGVLGPLEVRAADRTVPLPRPKERRLLAALLVHLGEAVSAGSLVEAVWAGDAHPARPESALRTLVSRLRATLGESTIVTAPAGYRLSARRESVDAGRFERLADEGRAAVEDDPESALVALDDGLGLWRGDAYEEFRHEPFAQAEAARLEELRAMAVEARIDARLALGDHQALVGELQTLIARHSYAERLREQLAVALYRSGRQADALAALRSYRELIAEELGLEPSPSLQQVEFNILTHHLEDRATSSPPFREVARRWADELSVPATSFVGREEVRDQVLGLLHDVRLITLTGPGGVGKTRLAARVAEAAAPDFADGVAACSLAPVLDPAAVPAAVATAIGIRRRQHRSTEESLVDALATRRMLLVLDNCEHVVDIAARLASLLTRRCPHLRVLATSRERLGLSGEHLVDVPPLPVPRSGSVVVTGTAVELFGERARALGIDLAGDPEAIDAVASLCRRLDGLPLAVELAAAQVRAMHPADIAARVSGSTSPVLGRLRDVSDRHRSLQAVTDWSYHLLTEPERELFDGLGVFAGSFDADAAGHVAELSGLRMEMADVLGGLIDKSMVTVQSHQQATRYALLETLRTYARERLTKRGTEARWRHAHALHYLAVIEQGDRGLVGPDEAYWMRRLALDMDNLREARRWSIDHDVDLAVRIVAGLTWYRFRTIQSELEEWAEDTAARAPHHPLVPLLLGSAALGAWSRGELDRGRRLAHSVVAPLAQPEPVHRVAYDALGAIALVTGDLHQSLSHFEQATALCRQSGDRFHEAWTLASRAVIQSYLDPPVDGANLLDEAEAIAHQIGCPSALAWVAYAQGEVLLETEPERALRLLDRSEALAREIGNLFVRGVAGVSAATLRARYGEPAQALPHLADLIEHWQLVGNRTQLWIMLRTVIHVLARAGQYEAAAVLHGALQTSPTAPPPYGPDHDRLAEAARTVARHATTEEIGTWHAHGRAMTDHEAIEFARTAIEKARLQKPPRR